MNLSVQLMNKLDLFETHCASWPNIADHMVSQAQ